MKIFFYGFLSLFFWQSAFAQTVFITQDEALKLYFPGAPLTKEKKILTPEQKTRLEEGKIKISKDDWNFWVARSGSKITGYALVDNEIGKVDPITFMTVLNPDGSLKALEVLVYREAYGSNVASKPFLKQYAGKKISDPLTIGKDINNVTGATLSAKASTRAAKRALALWNIFYGR